jgi:hypothetical protein
MLKQAADLKPAENINGVVVWILPLLQLHSTNYSLMEMPDTKAISCNMCNFQLAQIICKSPQDNMLVKLRKEIENSLLSVLDGDVVVVVSSFTPTATESNLPPMRSVSFVEDNENQSQQHFCNTADR